ncbi:MAG: histidine phosphatase family protein [Dehalococcoidales bacterium]
MTRLFLVRHGKIEGESDRYYGHTAIGLSQEGVRQAEMLRDHLASRNLGMIYSSDLKRAFDTAGIIATTHKLKVIPCSDLREFDIGRLVGMTFEEMKERYQGAVRLLSGQEPDISAPGGESLRQMSTRIQRFVAEVQKQPPEQMLIVAHGGSLKVLLCLLLGISLEHWWQFRLAHASLTVVETYPEGAVLCLLNDTSHLERSQEIS